MLTEAGERTREFKIPHVGVVLKIITFKLF